MAGERRLFGGLALHFHLPGIEDERGLLVPVELQRFDFRPAHCFLVKGRDGATRGGHAHRRGRQVLLRVSGTIEVALRLNGQSHRVVLDERANALLIGSPVWSSQTYRGAEPGLLVLGDHPFDPDGYVAEPG